MFDGRRVPLGITAKMSQHPCHQLTENYLTGRFD